MAAVGTSLRSLLGLEKKGRSVDVPTESLPNDSVQLKPIKTSTNDDEEDQPHSSSQTDWGTVPPTGDDGWDPEEPGIITDNAWKRVDGLCTCMVGAECVNERLEIE